MKEQTHTPTPWRAHDMEYDAIVGPDRKAIALVMGRSRTPAEDAANLAHIVHCVNHHEKLVEALTLVLDFIEPNNISANLAEAMRKSRATLESSRAALTASKL